MRNIIVFLCLCAPSVFCGSWFSKDDVYQSAEGEIDQACLAKAAAGDCEFYPCFDRRHPCNKHNYALSYGWRYCTRFDNHMDEFTEGAQRWIDSSRKCIMEKMAEFYEEEEISCTEVEAVMKAAHAQCDAEHGICDMDMLSDNNGPLGNVYHFGRRSVVRMMYLVKECGEDAMDMVYDLVMDDAVPQMKRVFGRIADHAREMTRWVRARMDDDEGNLEDN